MVVFGTFVLLRAPLDGNFIAAMLTILGYSINDTVVSTTVSVRTAACWARRPASKSWSTIPSTSLPAAPSSPPSPR